MSNKHIKYLPANKHFRLTKKGLDNLKAQLDSLRSEQLKMSRQLIGMDEKEKEEFIISTDAINKLDSLEYKVSKITDILLNADVISENQTYSSVELGSTVFLESDLERVKYTLVNSIEADPSVNKISEDSPLGRALIGKAIHSIIKISSPRGKKYSYRVIAVK